MTRNEREVRTDGSLSSPVYYRVTITGVMGQSSVGCTRRFGSFRALKKYMGVRSADGLFPEGVGSVLRKVGIKLSEQQLKMRAKRLQAWLKHLLANSGSQLSHWQAEALAQFLHMQLISKPSSDPTSAKLTAQPTPAFLPRSHRAYSSSPPCVLNDKFSLKEVKEVDESRTDSGDARADSTEADSTEAVAGVGMGARGGVAPPTIRRSSLTPEAA
mmetsp:Transcript_88797/g.253798  ORF Transcript_88797/g.253798 Transcript_88797/m.253798 type:complete len:215 (+) Transcript_88797:470-1114(+)